MKKQLLIFLSISIFLHVPIACMVKSHLKNLTVIKNVNNKSYNTNAEGFLAGTKVRVPGGDEVEIEKLKIDHVVLATDIKKNDLPRKITYLQKKKLDHFFKVKLSDEEFNVAPSQKFYVNNKSWVKAKDLTLSDLVLTKNGEKISVNALEKINEESDSYLIDVAEDHNFYVGKKDIHAHNSEFIPFLMDGVAPVIKIIHDAGPVFENAGAAGGATGLLGFLVVGGFFLGVYLNEDQKKKKRKELVDSLDHTEKRKSRSQNNRQYTDEDRVRAAKNLEIECPGFYEKLLQKNPEYSYIAAHGKTIDIKSQEYREWADSGHKEFLNVRLVKNSLKALDGYNPVQDLQDISTNVTLTQNVNNIQSDKGIDVRGLQQELLKSDMMQSSLRLINTIESQKNGLSTIQSSNQLSIQDKLDIALKAGQVVLTGIQVVSGAIYIGEKLIGYFDPNITTAKITELLPRETARLNLNIGGTAVFDEAVGCQFNYFSAIKNDILAIENSINERLFFDEKISNRKSGLHDVVFAKSEELNNRRAMQKDFNSLVKLLDAKKQELQKAADELLIYQFKQRSLINSSDLIGLKELQLEHTQKTREAYKKYISENETYISNTTQTIAKLNKEKDPFCKKCTEDLMPIIHPGAWLGNIFDFVKGEFDGYCYPHENKSFDYPPCTTWRSYNDRINVLTKDNNFLNIAANDYKKTFDSDETFNKYVSAKQQEIKELKEKEQQQIEFFNKQLDKIKEDERIEEENIRQEIKELEIQDEETIERIEQEMLLGELDLFHTKDFKSIKKEKKRQEVMKEELKSGSISKKPDDDDEDKKKKKRIINKIEKSEFFKRSEIRENFEQVREGIYKVKNSNKHGLEKVKKATYLEWDYLHNEVEVYDAGRKHLGALDPKTLEIIPNSQVLGRMLPKF